MFCLWQTFHFTHNTVWTHRKCFGSFVRTHDLCFFRIRGSHTVCTEWWQNEIMCANAGKCATFILLTHICLFLHMYVCIFSIWLLFFYYCIKALERMWSKGSSSIDCSIVLYLLCTLSVSFFMNMLQMISRECTDDITIAKLNVPADDNVDDEFHYNNKL